MNSRSWMRSSDQTVTEVQLMRLLRNWWITYLLLVVPSTILLNLTFPNFHAPDDYDHLKRAYTLVHGPFRIITPKGRSTGAFIDRGLTDYIDAQIPLVRSTLPLSQAQRAALDRASHLRWTGELTFSEMPGALSYFPLLYAPQTIALEISRVLGARVELSVLFARALNSIVAIALATIGLHLLKGGEAIVLFLLLLPRTLLQFASNSADPILYGLALIIVALGLRTCTSPRLRTGILGFTIFVASTVRPTVAALALPAGVCALRKRRWPSFFLLAASCALAAIWITGILPSITDERCGNLGTFETKVRNFAFDWPQLITHTIAQRAGYYYTSWVGYYGWGDARTALIGNPMPNWVYLTALPIFAIAMCRDLLSASWNLHVSARISLVAGAACALFLTFFAMYVGCTAAGQTVIGGVQGRYFIIALFPMAPAIGGLLSARGTVDLNGVFLALIVTWSVACTATMLAACAQLYIR